MASFHCEVIQHKYKKRHKVSAEKMFTPRFAVYIILYSKTKTCNFEPQRYKIRKTLKEFPMQINGTSL